MICIAETWSPTKMNSYMSPGRSVRDTVWRMSTLKGLRNIARLWNDSVKQKKIANVNSNSLTNNSSLKTSTQAREAQSPKVTRVTLVLTRKDWHSPKRSLTSASTTQSSFSKPNSDKEEVSVEAIRRILAQRMKAIQKTVTMPITLMVRVADCRDRQERLGFMKTIGTEKFSSNDS